MLTTTPTPTPPASTQHPHLSYMSPPISPYLDYSKSLSELKVSPKDNKQQKIHTQALAYLNVFAALGIPAATLARDCGVSVMALNRHITTRPKTMNWSKISKIILDHEKILIPFMRAYLREAVRAQFDTVYLALTPDQFDYALDGVIKDKDNSLQTIFEFYQALYSNTERSTRNRQRVIFELHCIRVNYDIAQGKTTLIDHPEIRSMLERTPLARVFENCPSIVESARQLPTYYNEAYA